MAKNPNYLKNRKLKSKVIFWYHQSEKALAGFIKIQRKSFDLDPWDQMSKDRGGQ